MNKLLYLVPIAFFLMGCLNSTASTETTLNSSNVTNGFSPGLSWQWQLSGPVNTSYVVNVYDVDLFETPQSVIDELHSKNVRVICYFSAGTSEDFRSDFSDFPSEVMGLGLEEWPGEKWLDVSSYDKFSSVMEKRLDLAKEKKCDAVEPDNVDGYVQDSGFEITSQNQIDYNKWLASQAHKRDLRVGLKNDLDQVNDLVSDFDFAVNEQCFEFNECDKLSLFVNENKAVFGVEYNLEKEQFCKQANELKFSWLKMNLELNGSRDAC